MRSPPEMVSRLRAQLTGPIVRPWDNAITSRAYLGHPAGQQPPPGTRSGPRRTLGRGPSHHITSIKGQSGSPVLRLTNLGPWVCGWLSGPVRVDPLLHRYQIRNPAAACLRVTVRPDQQGTGSRERPLRHDQQFEEFYQASYGRIVAMVAAMTGSKQEAEDIAQEAYARALARWPRLRGYDLPEAWVRKVALRLAIDSGRRLRRNLAAAVRLAAQRRPADHEPDDDLKYTPLGAALASLPIHERQVVVLHYVTDLPVNAIAAECGLPVGTVKTRLAVARRHLEQKLTSRPEAVA